MALVLDVRGMSEVRAKVLAPRAPAPIIADIYRDGPGRAAPGRLPPRRRGAV